MIVSKSKLKAKMLSVFRQVERTGEEVIVTDHGKPTLKISPLPKSESVESVFGKYRGAVIYREEILESTVDEWPEV